MTLEQNRSAQESTTPSVEKQEALPETVYLRAESRKALEEILQRHDTLDHASADDVVATAITVFNVLTRHLSQKDSKVILHTVGESLKTLHIPNVNGARPLSKNTVMPPKMTW